MTKEFFDITPKPGFLRAMQNQKWTVSGALSELVDNSFGAGRGNAGSVWINYHISRRTITVMDDGNGMDTVGRLFQLGNTIGLKPGDIGVYGSGGTLAILWLARVVDVFTLRDNKVMNCRMIWEKQFRAASFFSVPTNWQKASAQNTPVTLLERGHGTLVHIQLLPGRQINPSHIIRDLAQTYSPGLRNGQQLRWTTFKKEEVINQIFLEDPFESPKDNSDLVTFDLTIDHGPDNKLLPITGRIGLIKDLPQSRSRIAVGFGHRVILMTRDCFQSADGEEKFLGTGITGWLQLGEGWQPYLTVTKDGISDGNLWQTIMQYVFQEIRPLLEKVEVSEFRMVFDEISLSLTESLREVSMIRVTVPRDLPDFDKFADEPRGREFKEKSEPQQKEEGNDNAEQPRPAETMIQLVELSDEAMSGTLCNAQRDQDDIIVTVNRDHPWIVEALKAKPINRRALSYMVSREIARKLIEDDGLLKKVLTPSLFAAVQEKDEANREGYITRLLLDRAA